MSNYNRVIQEIKRLESIIPSSAPSDGDRWDFRGIWIRLKPQGRLLRVHVSLRGMNTKKHGTTSKTW